MIESKDCRDCAKEIESKVKRKLSGIISHRNKCRKCIGCERLNQAKDAAKDLDKMGKEK